MQAGGLGIEKKNWTIGKELPGVRAWHEKTKKRVNAAVWLGDNGGRRFRKVNMGAVKPGDAFKEGNVDAQGGRTRRPSPSEDLKEYENGQTCY